MENRMKQTIIAVSLLLAAGVGCNRGNDRQLPDGTKIFGERTLKDGTHTVERKESPDGHRRFNETRLKDGTVKAERIESPNGEKQFDVTQLPNGSKSAGRVECPDGRRILNERWLPDGTVKAERIEFPDGKKQFDVTLFEPQRTSPAPEVAPETTTEQLVEAVASGPVHPSEIAWVKEFINNRARFHGHSSLAYSDGGRDEGDIEKTAEGEIEEHCKLKVALRSAGTWNSNYKPMSHTSSTKSCTVNLYALPNTAFTITKIDANGEHTTAGLTLRVRANISWLLDVRDEERVDCDADFPSATSNRQTYMQLTYSSKSDAEAAAVKGGGKLDQ